MPVNYESYTYLQILIPTNPGIIRDAKLFDFVVAPKFSSLFVTFECFKSLIFEKNGLKTLEGFQNYKI